MSILIYRDGQNFGPYSAEEVRAYLQSSELAPTDLAWQEGMTDWQPLTELPQFAGSGPAALNPSVQYHHVAPAKFILLSIGTLGLYEIYWFYKNWKFLRDRDQLNIWPFLRALFSPLTSYWVFREVQLTREGMVTALAPLLAIAYLLIHITWRLPDPWWLISMFTFLPLLLIVRAIDQINRQSGARSSYYARFHLGHAGMCLVGGVILLFAAFSSLQIFPSTAVLAGDQLPHRTIQFLKDNGIVNESEEVIYYYSTAMFSIKEDGNILTDQRVISYYWDPMLRELVIDTVLFDEIVDIHVFYARSFFEDTELYIETEDEDEILLYLSAENKGDRKFVEKLNALRSSR